MSFALETLRDLWGPGLVFLLLVGWLVRKAWKAARTEDALEHEQEQTVAEALREQRMAGEALGPQRSTPAGGPPDPLSGADTSHARSEHVALVAALLAGEAPRRPVTVAWVRSLGAHVAWLERGLGGAQGLQVIRVEAGAAAQRWTFE